MAKTKTKAKRCRRAETALRHVRARLGRHLKRYVNDDLPFMAPGHYKAPEAKLRKLVDTIGKEMTRARRRVEKACGR